jgi:hypothetical protein
LKKFSRSSTAITFLTLEGAAGRGGSVCAVVIGRSYCSSAGRIIRPNGVFSTSWRRFLIFFGDADAAEEHGQVGGKVVAVVGGRGRRIPACTPASYSPGRYSCNTSSGSDVVPSLIISIGERAVVRFAGIAGLDPVAKVHSILARVHYDGGVVYSIDLWSLVPDTITQQHTLSLELRGATVITYPVTLEASPRLPSSPSPG